MASERMKPTKRASTRTGRVRSRSKRRIKPAIPRPKTRWTTCRSDSFITPEVGAEPVKSSVSGSGEDGMQIMPAKQPGAPRWRDTP
ncbi:MAG: hypothetical protein CVV31_06045 [Methanomicrobiales archaeon HGW-Methanomicrobiales-2]|nr:MAG: hypothetical protein CVV31_06045 [Methanomicrobiales archaeon HGW-Methanomicrobiales-2]